MELSKNNLQGAMLFSFHIKSIQERFAIEI